MRKTYLDNIRFITVAIVVLYHVIYIFNGITEFGIIGPFSDNQPQDIFMYIVYPWFMLLLFVVSGISARYELEKLSEKEFIRKRTRKLLVPSTIGLLVFGWITMNEVEEIWTDKHYKYALKVQKEKEMENATNKEGQPNNPVVEFTGTSTEE